MDVRHSQLAAAAAAREVMEELGELSVSAADVTWFIHIISSTHLARSASGLTVRLNNVLCVPD